MLPPQVLSGAPSRSFRRWRVVQLWPGDIFSCLSCFLVKKHAAFKWKDAISGFPVSPGSAEAIVRWGGKIKYTLIAYFLGNICAKNCRNRTVYVKIIASQKWNVFLRYSQLYLKHSQSVQYFALRFSFTTCQVLKVIFNGFSQNWRKSSFWLLTAI